MIKTGLIIKIEDKYAIVMTKNNSYQRIIKKDNMNIGSEIMYTESDVMQNYRKKRVNFMKKKLLFSIPVFAIVFMLVLFNAGNLVNTDNQELLSATIITVDINPSFKIYADEDNIVLKVESLNEDAKTIKSDDLVSMTVINAVDLIVNRAETSGFIDTKDLEEDYVLITTIDANETDSINNAEMIMTQLKTKAQTSESLGKVNIAMTQANMTQLKKAEQNNNLVGLTTMNKGNSTTVKEFFANDENVQLFEENGYMIQNSFNHQLKIMQTTINESNFDTELQNSFSSEFQYAKNAYIEVANQYQQALIAYKNASDSNAQTLLNEAEQLRIKLEENKDNVSRLRIILNKAVNKEESQEELMEQLTSEKQLREANQVNKPTDTGNTQENSQSQSSQSDSQQQNNSNTNSSGGSKK